MVLSHKIKCFWGHAHNLHMPLPQASKEVQMKQDLLVACPETVLQARCSTSIRVFGVP